MITTILMNDYPLSQHKSFIVLNKTDITLSLISGSKESKTKTPILPDTLWEVSVSDSIDSSITILLPTKNEPIVFDLSKITKKSEQYFDIYAVRVSVDTGMPTEISNKFEVSIYKICPRSTLKVKNISNHSIICYAYRSGEHKRIVINPAFYCILKDVFAIHNSDDICLNIRVGKERTINFYSNYTTSGVSNITIDDTKPFGVQTQPCQPSSSLQIDDCYDSTSDTYSLTIENL